MRKERLTVTIDQDLIEVAEEAVVLGEADSVSAWVNGALAEKAAKERRLKGLAKAIAAYERRIQIAPNSRFDAFVEGVKESDAAKQQSLSPEARRGLKLFLSGANCSSSSSKTPASRPMISSLMACETVASASRTAASSP